MTPVTAPFTGGGTISGSLSVLGTITASTYTAVTDMLLQAASGQLTLRTGPGSRVVTVQDASNAPLLYMENGTRGVSINKASAPVAALDVTQITLGSHVQVLTSTATNDDPTEATFQNRVATTDATVTTIQSIAIPASTTVGIVCTVVNRRTGGVSGTAEDGAHYELRVVLKNVAGTATEIAAEVLAVIGESIAGYTVASTPSGANTLIQVTGAATTNITWHSHCTTYAVGT